MSHRGVVLALVFAAGLCILSLVVFQAPIPPAYGQTVPPPGQTVPAPTSTPQMNDNGPDPVTVYVSPSMTTVLLGGDIQVTVTVMTTPTCQFPIYDITLSQAPYKPLFTYLDPPTNTVGPPVTNPVVFKLHSARPGTINIYASAYGLLSCAVSQGWRYESGYLPDVQVLDRPYRLSLPYVQKSTGRR